MMDLEYNINELFAQLGLPNDDEEIDAFVREHKIASDISIHDAPFWSDAQRAFLLEEWRKDAQWVQVIDELNACLHSGSYRK